MRWRPKSGHPEATVSRPRRRAVQPFEVAKGFRLEDVGTDPILRTQHFGAMMRVRQWPTRHDSDTVFSGTLSVPVGATTATNIDDSVREDAERIGIAVQRRVVIVPDEADRYGSAA